MFILEVKKGVFVCLFMRVALLFLDENCIGSEKRQREKDGGSVWLLWEPKGKVWSVCVCERVCVFLFLYKGFFCASKKSMFVCFWGLLSRSQVLPLFCYLLELTFLLFCSRSKLAMEVAYELCSIMDQDVSKNSWAFLLSAVTIRFGFTNTFAQVIVLHEGIQCPFYSD